MWRGTFTGHKMSKKIYKSLTSNRESCPRLSVTVISQCSSEMYFVDSWPTNMFQELNVTCYLRKQVRFPGHLFPTARPEVSSTLRTFSWFNFIHDLTFHALDTTTNHEVRTHQDTGRSMVVDMVALQQGGVARGIKTTYSRRITAWRGSLVRQVDVSRACSRAPGIGACRHSCASLIVLYLFIINLVESLLLAARGEAVTNQWDS